MSASTLIAVHLVPQPSPQRSRVVRAPFARALIIGFLRLLIGGWASLICRAIDPVRLPQMIAANDRRKERTPKLAVISLRVSLGASLGAT